MSDVATGDLSSLLRLLRRAAETDPLARLVVAIIEERADAIPRAIARIRDAVPAYDPFVPDVGESLEASARAYLRTVLRLLLERRGPTERELATWAELGERRARQNLQVTDVLRALRVGSLELWEVLTDQARRLGQPVADELLRHAGLLWHALDELSAAVATAHAQVSSARVIDARSRAVRFVAGLEAPPGNEDELARQAREIGLDPSGTFVAAVLPPGGMAWRHREAVVAEQPDRTVVMAQVGTGDAAERQVARELDGLGHRQAGIGLARPGLEGARASLHDAEQALRVAVVLGTGQVRFRHAWFECLVLGAAERLDPLFAPLVDAIAGDEPLAETVQAFLWAEGRLTMTGQRLHLHPNTVAYRLQRLADRTGLDPRTLSGAAAARAALTLSRVAAPPQPAEV